MSVVVVAICGLTACQQMLARFTADSKAIAQRFTPETTPPSDTANAKPEVDKQEASQSSSARVEVSNTPAEKITEKRFVQLAEKPFEGSADTQVDQQAVKPLDKKFTSSNLPKTDSESSPRVVAVHKPTVQTDTKPAVSNSKPVSRVQTSHVPVLTNVSDDSNETYQRANASQVNLRNGDVSIDFSKDMPVINSRIGIDLNSQ